MTTENFATNNGGLLAPAQNKKSKTKKIVLLVVKYVVAALLCAFFFFPYLFMINKSLMSYVQIAGGGTFWTRSFNIQNYAIIKDYLRSIGNTLIVVGINGFFVPFTALFCAFPLARIKFFGKKVMFGIIMATVMIPSSVLMVPTFILFMNVFHLYDKLASQWIGAFWGGGALNIFLAIQFMRSIPREIDNAAKIDGANWFQIYFRIMFPLCFNIFLFIGVNIIIGLWMDFQTPLIYLSSPEKFTMGLAFYHAFNSDGALGEHTEWMMAMCVFITIIPMTLFLCFQKQMIGGVQMGSLK